MHFHPFGMEGGRRRRIVVKNQHGGGMGELRNVGYIHGGQLDKPTRFIHLSIIRQVRPTLQRFFPNTDKDLYLLQIDAKKLGDGVAYEAVGASNEFAHFYGPSRSFASLSRLL